MTTQIKRRRGTTAEHASFTGAEGELTIDTTKDTVVVHDGATAGGYPLAKENGSTFTNVDINSGTIDGVTIGGASAGAITGTTITGTSFVSSGNMTFGDDDKAIFGAGSDLQIYHNGTYSHISDEGTGSLVISTNGNNIQLAKGTSELMVVAYPDGAVDLYHNNSVKLATTATGIDVTGTVTADGLTVAQSSGANILLESTTTGATTGDIFGEIEFKTNDASSPGIKAKIDAYSEGGVGNTALRLFTGDTTGLYQRLNIASNGDISFYEPTGTTPKLFWDASTERLGLGTTTPVANIHIEQSGTNPYLRVTETGNTGIDFGQETNGNGLINLRDSAALRVFTSATERLRIDSSGQVGIGTTSPQRLLHLSNDGSTAQLILQDTDRNDTGEYWLFEAQDGDLEFQFTNSNTGALTSIQTVLTLSPTASVFNEGGNDRDFRVESDTNANAFFLEGSSGNVGIGTASPAGTFVANGPTIGLGNNLATSNGVGGAFSFVDPDGATIQTTVRLGSDSLTAGSNVTDLQIINYGAGDNAGGGSIRFINSRTSSETGLIKSARETLFTGYLDFYTQSSGLKKRMRLASNGDISFYEDTGVTPKLFWDASQEFLGLGTNSPLTPLYLQYANNSGTNYLDSDAGFIINNTGSNGSTIKMQANANIIYGSGSNTLVFSDRQNERMRIDSSGNMVVGKTNANANDAGIVLNSSGRFFAVVASDDAVFNRTTTDGSIISLRKNGTTVGSIGVNNGVRPYFARPTKAGITIGGASALEPTTDDGTANDGGMDLGGAGARFKDLYLSGSVYLGGTTSANALR
jgi:hypothetical protein